MTQANVELRTAAKTANVPLWRVADALAISEASMSRLLRRELPEDEQKKILGIIHRLAEEETK